MNHAHIQQDRRKTIIVMILISALFHAGIISAAIFVTFRFHLSTPKSLKRFKYYEVSLVEVPERFKKKEKKSKIKTIKTKTKSHLKEKSSYLPQKREKSIVIPKKKIKISKKKIISEEKIIEQAISKIKRKVRKKKEEDIIEQAISKIKSQIKREQGLSSVQEGEGLNLKVYTSIAKSLIESNWVYPPALLGLAKKDLEAVVILKIKRSGQIIKFWFKKKSNDTIFDTSIIKAIKKSNPLPPLPEGYKKRYEEIEIHFSLSELASS